ncbi:MAG: hypothetical protein ACREOF_10735 [Gemmatimonadales bacterium]
MSRRGSALVLALACAGFACGGNDNVGPRPAPPPPPAEAGPIDFAVTTPATHQHGALLVTIGGGTVDSVAGMQGYDVFHSITSTGARAMVFGAIVDGRLIRVWVPDASQAVRYSVQVDEGAVRGTYEVLPGSRYQVTRQP